MADAPLFGVGAEFADAAALEAGVREMSRRRLGRIDAFSPVPVPGVMQALGLRAPLIRPLALIGVLAGFAACMAMCAYATGYAYVLNIGGRPDVAWPSYVVPSFSFSLIVAALMVTLGMIGLNRMPKLNHPAFNTPGFARATHDRYFLIVEAPHDRLHESDPSAIERALAALPSPPLAVSRVPR